MTEINTLNAAGPAPTPGEQRLRKVVGELEGVFVEQLFKAMRNTVPTDSLTHGGAGEEMFTALLDQHLASAAPAQWSTHGIGEALYRQLRSALPPAPATPGETP